ncbi:uncharacterized protein [Diadema antillarum]|uniref:uncharacterized protein n=1 Tax=Diadema antillarum TaxID=105358 RepID=UPI003A87DC02
MMDKLSIHERFKFARQPIKLDQIPRDQFPLIVRIVECTVEGSGLSNKEILRLNGDGFERRVLAVDSSKRTWSFPVHTGAKFDIVGKKNDAHGSTYIREIIENSSNKRPKKIRFSQIDTSQIRVAGQDPDPIPSDLILKIKQVSQVRYFTANRLVAGEIDPKVIILPSSIDVTITVATGLIGSPQSAMTSYMDDLTQGLKAWVNFDMCRGSSDILLYEEGSKSSLGRKALPSKSAPTRPTGKIVRVSTVFQAQRARREQQQATIRRPSDFGGSTTANGCLNGNQPVKGSTMASMMAASRGESIRRNDQRNQSTLEWLKVAETGKTNAVVAGDEQLNEEEQRALMRHRMRLLASLDDYGYGGEESSTNEISDSDVSRNNNEEGEREGVVAANDVESDTSHASENAISKVDDNATASTKTKETSERGIAIPITIEETDGSHYVRRTDGRTRGTGTHPRYGAFLEASLSTLSCSDRDEPPVLGQSRLVPIEFSGSNFVSVTKKWGYHDDSSSAVTTSKEVTKRKSVLQFFTAQSSTTETSSVGKHQSRYRDSLGH